MRRYAICKTRITRPYSFVLFDMTNGLICGLFNVDHNNDQILLEYESNMNFEIFDNDMLELLDNYNFDKIKYMYKNMRNFSSSNSIYRIFYKEVVLKGNSPRKIFKPIDDPLSHEEKVEIIRDSIVHDLTFDDLIFLTEEDINGMELEIDSIAPKFPKGCNIRPKNSLNKFHIFCKFTFITEDDQSSIESMSDTDYELTDDEITNVDEDFGEKKNRKNRKNRKSRKSRKSKKVSIKNRNSKKSRKKSRKSKKVSIKNRKGKKYRKSKKSSRKNRKGKKVVSRKSKKNRIV